ncbi:flavin reductase family protein [Aureimonas flava]|uniref:Flavin reductase family protein n=1 Tax=Aureimonas flava TaxID=2320271 RepID=A0A3A1WT48_9HYPH|nr:flavin reductase family protein [Aureimonas flava]RIY03781.1 flavin reductase family protein [Aureimonas flava]
MFYETATNDHGLAHDPFKAIVAPRPIGWISTRARDGSTNLAPYSFFNALSDRPKLVMFCSTGMKHSAGIAIETGEFVVNLATRELAEAVNLSSAPASAGDSEFALTGLSEAPCRLVAAPRVAEAPAALECRLTQWFRPVGLDGAEGEAVMVIGQVVGIHIDERILRDGRIALDLARPLSRLGYLDFASTDEAFEMRRPKIAEAKGQG